MRILILGGGRFQGRRVAEMLRDQGHDIVVMNHSGAVPGVRFVDGDRHDLSVIGRLLHEDYDVVVDNLAYQASDITDLLPLVAGRVGHYVFVSSFVVYLPPQGHRAVREDDADLASQAGSAYDVGKRQCEETLQSAGGTVPWTALRFANIGGPGDPSNRRGFFLDRVRDGHGVLLPSDYPFLCQPLWRDDAASAVMLTAGNPAAYGRAFNVADDTIYTASEWLSLLADAAHCQTPPIVSLPYDALRRLAGFNYRVPLPGRPILDTGAIQALGFTPTPAAAWLPAAVAWWASAGLTSRFWETRDREIAALKRLGSLWEPSPREG